MDGYVTIGTKLDSSMIDKEIGLLEDKLDGLLEEYDALEKAKPFEGQNKELLKLSKEIETTRKRLNKLNSSKFADLQNSINNIGTGITSITRKVGKWALAIFGVQSAYNGIKSAMHTIASQDKQLGADIEYMKNALAYSLEPVVRGIVNLAKQLMTYLQYIIYKWTGYNIFENANKSLKNANKNAKKLKNTLASFDELNILGDKDSGDTTTTPSFDLSKIEDIEIPKWVQWIADNKETILTVLGALAATFTASKVAGWVRNLSGLQSALGYGGGVLGLLKSIAAIGAIVILVEMGKKIWDDAQNLKEQIKEITEQQTESNMKQIDEINDINELLDWSNNLRLNGYRTLKDSENVFGKILGISQEQLNTVKANVETINEQIDKEYEIYKQGELTEEQKERLLNNIMMQVEYNKKVIEALQQEGKDTTELEEHNKIIAGYGNDIYQSMYNTNEELYEMNSLNLKDKDLKVKIDADTSAAEAQTSSWLSGLWSGIQNIGKEIGNVVKTGVEQRKSDASYTINWWKQKLGFKSAKGSIYIPPKLAVGGIINQPGRGIPLGSAIGGERGAEGVIPLTDSQQMALLGEAIGRYITVNANIVNTMNGRVISRELKKVQNEDSFASNR